MPVRNSATSGRSVIACFFNAVFHMFEIAAIYYTILALLDGKTGPATAWQALGLLAVSIWAAP